MLKKLIGTKAFYKRVFMLTIPIMIQQGITNFVNMLDNVMVGRIGQAESTGVAVTNQLIFVFTLCIFGAISGAGIFTAQFFGNHDFEGVKQTFRFKIIFCTLLTAAGVALFYFKSDDLIMFYLNEQDFYDQESPTVSGYVTTYALAMVNSPFRSELEKVLPNGEKVKAYPISSSQQMMYLMSLKYGSGYPVNNIGCGYYWQGETDIDVLKESVYEAIGRCDTMRLRFTMEKKLALHQYVTEKSQLIIDEWDYSDMTVEEAQEKLTAYSRCNIPMFNCEIHKIILIKFKDGYHGIFMRIHHLAMDAYSIKVFINDIIEIYKHRTKGTAYPKPMREYIPVLEKELAYEDSEQCKIDKQYWFDSLAKTSEPIFTDYLIKNRLKEQQKKQFDKRYADIHSGTPDAHARKFSISDRDSAKIVKLCQENALSMNSVISMGVRTALSCFNDNQQDVSFKMIINRRGTIAEKKSGGLRINFMPMRSIIAPEETFTQAVNKISEVFLHTVQNLSGKE